jgi:hypothetical protein
MSRILNGEALALGLDLGVRTRLVKNPLRCMMCAMC